MKSSIIILLFLFSFTKAFCQVFEAKSSRVSLNIKKAPVDSIAPTLDILSPRVMKGYTVYKREKEIIINGKAEDNSGQVFIYVNDRRPDLLMNGKFQAKLNLSPGENKILVKARDKNNNSVTKSLVVYQDTAADITPPEIVLIQPVLTRGIIVVHDTSKNTFNVKWSIKDESKLTEVLINDIKVEVPANGEYSVDFPSAPDSILISAMDQYYNYSSKYFQLKKNEVPESIADSIIKGKFYALIIAIEEYHDARFPDLDFPVKDAKNFANVLTKNYLFDPENIYLLQNPQRSKIIQKFNELKRKINKNDNFVIFYAGHGQWDDDLKQGFWLPSDASSSDLSEWLSNSTVKEFIRGIKSKHTLLIADACFSGGIFKSRDLLLDAPVSVQETYKYTSRRAITSGALKSVPDKSVFVEYLIKRLQENHDKFLTTQQLFISFKDAVVNNSPNNQTPMYGIIQETDDEGIGDFVFIHR